jgi:hypothetical protein
LYEVPADSTASLTINGPATSLAMSVPGQNGSVTFDGIAGQRVSVHVTSVTIGQSDLAILKPDGGTLAPARYVTTSGTFFDTMTLPTSGTYRISVNPRSAFTGSLSLRAYAVPADASGSLDPAGPATTVSVTVPGQNAAATFVGTAGARVSLNVTPVSIGASDIAILKPDGTVMAPSRYVGTGGTFFDTMTLPLAGTYRVTINPRDAQVGNATLRLYDVPADATVTLAVGGGPGTITTTVPGQNASATFAGNAAQAVTLVLSAVTIGQSDVSILKPDGSTLVAPVFVTTSGRTITTTLPVAGTYRIVVNPRATFTGNMTLQL